MKKILAVVAHPDDEALGCLGTLLHYRNKGYKVKVVFMSDGESSRKLSSVKKKKLINSRINQAKLVSKNQNLQTQSFLIFLIINLIQFHYLQL